MSGLQLKTLFFLKQMKRKKKIKIGRIKVNPNSFTVGKFTKQKLFPQKNSK